MRLHKSILAVLLLLVCQPAWAEKRVALIISNSAYEYVPRLPNPDNDGALIAQTLKSAGFDVVDYRHDLTALETRRALRDFADAAQNADIAVVYYAGHGMEVDGTNYLVPVDAKLERDTDVIDEALSLDRLLLAVEPARKLRLVILDACRDNPFTQNIKRTIATRGIGRGLAKIEPTSPNMLVAYAAKAGSTALDGDGKNSPFATALSKHLTTPGLDVRRAFGYVRDDVLKITGNRQEPFVYGSLGGDDVPLVPVKAVEPVQPADVQAGIRHDYELAMQIGSKAAWDAFLAQYPTGFYASLAKLQLEKIEAEEAHAAAVAKAQAAEQQRDRLAAEGAQAGAQAKAAADANAAEAARIAAEKVKQVAQDQAAEAERNRIAAQAAAASANASVSNSASAAARTADKGTTVASLTPSASSQAEIAKAVQVELRRVGCLSGNADGDWNAASQRSLSLFNRNAGTKLDVKAASADTLEVVKQKQSRVCPLVCEHGYKADGDHCTRIVCAEGTFLNDDNECERRHGKPAVAKREENRRDRRSRHENAGRASGRGEAGYDAGFGALPARPRVSSGRSQSSGAGQVICNEHLCRPVARGCHLEFHGGGGPGNVANAEVCN